MAKQIWGGKKITEIIKDAEEKQIKLGQAAEQINSIAKEANEKFAGIAKISTEIPDIFSDIQNAQEEAGQLKKDKGCRRIKNNH